MTSAIIIPARYSSTRFPGKPLIPIAGRDGEKRPLIEHTWRVATSVRQIDQIFIATDDERIAETSQQFGADVIMTSSDCRNGTERCAEALQQMKNLPEIVVNLQGDAPLTPPWFIEDLITKLRTNNNYSVATPVLQCDTTARERLLHDRRNGRVGGTTVTFGNNNQALYFSKEVLPYGNASTYHHVGVYGYRPHALRDFISWPEGVLEKSEGLEQLRFLENGTSVLCVEMNPKGHDFWEINNPEDVAIIEQVYRSS
jgi:3-deoxy-manno-octulosonate cytidylyltransferase (CMP-KDO synthetase)